MGHGRKIVMYPLSFRDFIRVADEALFRKLPEIKQFTVDEILSKTWRCAPYLDKLIELFTLYLQSEGMPLAVKSLLAEGQVSRDAYTTYLSWA